MASTSYRRTAQPFQSAYIQIYRNADGHAEMKYKHWTQDSWEPSGNQPGLKLLKVTKCSIINSIPRCVTGDYYSGSYL